MQFVAECGIENGLQIVIPIFLNPPNYLYIKKNCFSFQSYEELLTTPKLSLRNERRKKERPDSRRLASKQGESTGESGSLYGTKQEKGTGKMVGRRQWQTIDAPVSTIRHWSVNYWTREGDSPTLLFGRNELIACQSHVIMIHLIRVSKFSAKVQNKEQESKKITIFFHIFPILFLPQNGHRCYARDSYTPTDDGDSDG